MVSINWSNGNGKLYAAPHVYQPPHVMEKTLERMAAQLKKIGILGIKIENWQVNFPEKQALFNKFFKKNYPEALSPLIFKIMKNAFLGYKGHCITNNRSPATDRVAQSLGFRKDDDFLKVYYKDESYVAVFTKGEKKRERKLDSKQADLFVQMCLKEWPCVITSLATGAGFDSTEAALNDVD